MIEGKELENRRGAKIDCKDTIQEYIDKSDWRIQANANSNYSFSGLVSQTSGKIIANYWLNEVYSKKEGDAHRNGDYHIHDLDCLTPYCFTEDTKIKTVDFGNITIKELLEKNVSTFTVVSFDGEKMVECNAHDLRCTRKDAELVEVEFEDGLVVRCTPDHKFLSLTPETDPETHEAYLKVEWKPAAYLTMRTVRKAYTCPIIKSDVIKLEEVEGVITESDAKNSFAKVISVKHLDYKEDVYCMTVDNTHCFALENGVIAHNCCGHDLQTLLQEGFNGVVSRVSSKPPKHLREALGQMANFIGILQSEWAGAQAFSSFDTLLAPYVFFDMMVEGITERDVKKALLSFVYNLNVPSRWGQAPFSNVTIDMTVPQTMRFLSPQRGNEPYFVRNWCEFLEAENLTDDPDEALEKNEGWNRLIVEARKRIGDYDSDEETILYSLTYQHFAPEMMIINKAYYEILSEGDCEGQPFTFPIPTVNITEDFDWDNPEYDFLFENAARYGSSYFQNFIGSQYLRDENGNLTIRDENAYSPNDIRSMAFAPTQEFVYLDNCGRIAKNEIKNIYKNWIASEKNRNYKFMFNGKFYPISEMFKIEYNKYPNMRKITLDNGYDVNVSFDHKCAVYENGKIVHKLSQDVVEGDVFVVSKSEWRDVPNIGTYENGRIIGFYLAEGWKDVNRIYFAININREDIVNEIVTFFTNMGLDTKVERQDEVSIFRICVYGKAASSYVTQFIRGEKATTKRIESCVWNTSHNFRKGIYDGYVETDGCGLDGNCVAHTTNKKLCKDLIVLASSLGKCLRYRVNKNNTRYFKEDKSDLVKFTSYELTNKKYDGNDEYYFVPVVSSKEVSGNVPTKPEFVYNFTIDTNEHLVEMPNGIISHQCCRLQLSKKALRKRGGGLFGSDAQTGSIGVVTINMPRLGYLYKGDIKGLYKRLGQLMDMARSTLDKKRAFVEEMYLRGLYPYTRRYVKTYDTYFSTIGVNGMNEMVRNFTNDEYDITDERGQKMCMEILDYMNKKMEAYQEDGKALWNLEATPAEGTTTRFAREDIKRYPDIIQAGFPDAPYYTNSSQLPVDFSSDVFSTLDLQDELQKKYTGGTVLHIYNDEDVTAEECKLLLKKVLTNYRLPYVSFTATFSSCPKHGRISGIHEYCPLCDKELMQKHLSEIDLNKA